MEDYGQYEYCRYHGWEPVVRASDHNAVVACGAIIPARA
jgi:hypothetical protein